MWSRPESPQRVCVGRRRALLGLLALAPGLLGGCGFRLRGRAELPESFKRLRITGTDRYGPLQVGLRRELAAHGVTVVDDASATARLEIRRERSEQRVLSRGGEGRAAEYQLLYRVEFRIVDPEGAVLLEPQLVEQMRDFTFDPEVVLAKADEEEMLREDMREEAIRQIMRRLEAAGEGAG